MGSGADIGNSQTRVARRRDHDSLMPVRRSTEGVSQVVGGDAPCVRRQVDERVDQRPAGALPRELADQLVGVHPVGGAEIDHAEHRLVRKRSPRRQHGWVGRRERGALRERIARIVVRHAREFGAI